MSLNKSDFEKIDERVKNITQQKVEQIEVDSDLPPTIQQLEDNNKTYSITAAILFIDIRKSTYLTESSQAKSMVKIYRSFMRMAVDCVRKNGGVTRRFMGDRIMGVFINSCNDNNEIIESASNKAVNTARSLQTVIDFSLNKHLKNNVNGKIIDCGIGIDYGKVLVTQVGMYGVEEDENKENEVDCVWVGNTTNHASKYSDIADGGEIFISDNVYKNLSEDLKKDNVWNESAKYKGSKIFKGYVAKEFYLDFYKELGNPVKIEDDSSILLDTSSGLVSGIKEIERLQDKLIKREKDLAVLEYKIKNDNQKLKKELEDISNKYSCIEKEKNELLNKIKVENSKYYELLYEFIKKSFLNSEYIKEVGIELWVKIIAEFKRVGKNLNYSDEQIYRSIDYYLVEIYSFFKLYSEAYDMSVEMAKNNNIWVRINDKSLMWAKENSQLWKLYDEVEKRLVNYTIPNDKRNDFEEYLNKIKAIRGW